MKKRTDFSEYKMSMLGRDILKHYVMRERRTVMRKLRMSMFLFILSALLSVYTIYHIVSETMIYTEYAEYFVDFCVVFFVTAIISLLLFILLLRHGYRYCLGKGCDLFVLRKGGYKISTLYAAGSYHRRGLGWGGNALKTLLEGSREIVIGTVGGSSVHAVNLTGELVDGSYRPCVVLDNGSVFVMPRTAVIAPRDH